MFLKDYQWLDKIIYFYNKVWEKEPPFIAHGLCHHFQVYNKCKELIDRIELNEPITEQNRNCLLFASLCHDSFRTAEILSSDYSIELLRNELTKIFSKNDSEKIIGYVNAHNNIEFINDYYSAIIYLADKFDYSFRRGFLVQIYNKIFDLSSQSTVDSDAIKRIIIELKEKNSNDLTIIKEIRDKYTLIPLEVFTDLEKKYISIYNISLNSIQKILSDRNALKSMIKKELKVEILDELKIKKDMKISLKNNRLLYYHLKIIKMKRNYMQKKLIDIVFDMGNIGIIL